MTLQVWDATKSTVIGSVEVSGKIADATSSAAKAGKNFVVDTSGTLLTASGQVIGQVWDSSSRAVGFVVDSTSKFFVGASNATVVIFTSASQNSINFAGHVWNGMKSGSTVPVQIVRASAKGSVMVVNASGQSLMAVSDTMGGIFQEKY